MIRSLHRLGLLTVLLLATTSGLTAEKATSTDDPVLRAMLAEMQRSKSQLKLADVQAPYYVDYRLTDVDQYMAEAAFGAMRTALRTRVRMLRIVVRVGDYKQDSYYGPGEGVVDVGPLDDDETGLRHQLWLGTDRAYKAASEALTAKQAELKKYSVDQQVDDFAHASPVQLVAPIAKLDFSPEPWLAILEERSPDPVAECFAALHGHQPIFRQLGRGGGAHRRQLLPGVRRRVHPGRRRHAPRPLARLPGPADKGPADESRGADPHPRIADEPEAVARCAG